ncbi:hypothetical protein ACLOAU_14415 [Niabella sp. CJ426]|uniref:hypothetical protein n=1 Tax=Niabella sp. CJ426 TaxID=3393740 RepID=UPI003CFF1319
MKKAISICLSVVLLVSIALTAFAKEDISGTGTPSDPFINTPPDGRCSYIMSRDELIGPNIHTGQYFQFVFYCTNTVPWGWSKCFTHGGVTVD